MVLPSWAGRAGQFPWSRIRSDQRARSIATEMEQCSTIVRLRGASSRTGAAAGRGRSKELRADEYGERPEGAVHEPIRVEPHARHVDAEPGEADDVAGDGHRHQALLAREATPAGVEKVGPCRGHRAFIAGHLHERGISTGVAVHARNRSPGAISPEKARPLRGPASSAVPESSALTRCRGPCSPGSA